MTMFIKRHLLVLGFIFVAINAFSKHSPVIETRDSVVVDSITGQARKYKLTDNKVLKPVYWVYNYLANSNLFNR